LVLSAGYERTQLWNVDRNLTLIEGWLLLLVIVRGMDGDACCERGDGWLLSFTTLA
jgi:hypothetical protein